MIAVVILLLLVLLLAATPWRRLPMAGRLWAAAALLNALVFFGMPITPGDLALAASGQPRAGRERSY